jgi:multidrug resistance efflux pump
MPPTEGDWSRYQNLVLTQLAELREENKDLRAQLETTRIEVAMLTVKAGVFGLVGGLLPFGLFIATQFLDGGGGP